MFFIIFFNKYYFYRTDDKKSKGDGGECFSIFSFFTLITLKYVTLTVVWLNVLLSLLF